MWGRGGIKAQQWWFTKLAAAGYLIASPLSGFSASELTTPIEDICKTPRVQYKEAAAYAEKIAAEKITQQTLEERLGLRRYVGSTAHSQQNIELLESEIEDISKLKNIDFKFDHFSFSYVTCSIDSNDNINDWWLVSIIDSNEFVLAAQLLLNYETTNFANESEVPYAEHLLNPSSIVPEINKFLLERGYSVEQAKTALQAAGFDEVVLKDGKINRLCFSPSIKRSNYVFSQNSLALYTILVPIPGGLDHIFCLDISNPTRIKATLPPHQGG
jgi:hypothetical protein